MSNPSDQNQYPTNSNRRPALPIPLQNLPRPPDESQQGAYVERFSQYDGGMGATYHPGGSYEQYPGPPQPPDLTTYWGDGQNPIPPAEESHSPGSPIDPMAFSFALPPDIRQTAPTPEPPPVETPAFQSLPAHYEEPSYQDMGGGESDRLPLTTHAQDISGKPSPAGFDSHARESVYAAGNINPSQQGTVRNSNMLGFDLEPGAAANIHRSYGNTLMPDDRRFPLAPSTSAALSKTGSIIRAMSTRVVDISGGGHALEQQARRERSRSRSPGADGRFSSNISDPMLQQDTAYHSQVFPGPTEKKSDSEYVVPEPPPISAYHPRPPMANPLKGKSLGIFPPDNRIRMLLCDILVLPWVEPLILLLIVLQAVLLAVDSAPNVWSPGRQRRQFWGTNTDWVLLGMFILFTLEVIARIIVSGFILNAAEYSTIDRKRGVRAVIGDQYKSFFRPQRQKSTKRPQTQQPYGPSTFARAATLMQGHTVPETLEENQRMQLARRAFLRHGFNRLDFVAVVSFWISFGLSINGLEKRNQLFLFRMLSSLRIIRLLGLTRGNAIILRSLKKAAPLLVRVSFLIGFFWLLFAIIGVQSFKNSLSRHCVYLDPEAPTDLTKAFSHGEQFCGGHLSMERPGDLTPVSWQFMRNPGDLTSKEPGIKDGIGKGFICPRGSICLQQGNPHNNTQSFDHILHSIELVFVIMSANTWSDIMYITVDSDYSQSALFFGAGIMIMMLWMTNLLIAVITSSFQVIREESKASAFTADEDGLSQTHQQDAIKRVSGLQRFLNKINWFWILLIALDLLVQCQHSAETDATIDRLMEVTQIVVTIFLTVEIILRFVANWRYFHHDLRNLADLFLVVANAVILLPPVRKSGQVYAWLTIFQILRIYRVILAVPITRDLIKLVMGNATGIGNLMLFVFLITFLMAIFASQMFRGIITLQDDGGKDIRINFKHIYNSFLGMYQVLSSEGWTEILYTVTAFTTEKRVSWIGAIFLIFWFTLSFFILVNMFIAVIQENFDVGEDQKRLEQVKAFLQRKELGGDSNPTLTSVFSFGREVKRKDPLDYGPAMMEMLLKEAVVRDFLDEPMDPLQDNADDRQSTQGVHTGANASLLARLWAAIVNKMTSKDPNPFYSNVAFQNNNNEAFDPRQMARQAVTASAARRKAQREYLGRHPNYNTSLFIFKPGNPIRKMCQRLVGPGRGAERIDGVEPNKYAWYAFSAFVYFCIIAMVVIACITTPLYQRDFLNEVGAVSLRNWFVWTDIAFAAVFSFEALIKVIADGFFWTPNAYFRSLWGLIDMVVLLTLLINVGTILAKDGAVSRAIGAFKALRALRLLNISDSARQTFQSFITWKIVSAGFVSMGLLVPFAIYGVNIFSGKLVKCNDGDLDLLVDCFGEYISTPFSQDWQMLAPRAASNPYFSFDDFPASLFILFQIVSQEGWTDVSFAVQEITGKGKQPKFGAAEGNAMFFVIFNLLATVFVLTVFISVFMRSYTERTGVAFLTADQRSWLELRKMLRQISPSKTSYGEAKSKWKKWCHKRSIEKRGRWYRSITGVLVLHLILLLLEYSTEPLWWTSARDALFLLFTVIYIGNIAIRITGLGFTRFRRSSWDLFSIVAVSGAFATSIMVVALPTQDILIKLHKLFLVAIVLLLIPRNDALDQLFKTAAASITTIGNLLATWLVFFVVFAIAMTQAFSLTRFGANETTALNFRNVPHAMILLFKISVGEGWNELMADFGDIEPPFCVDDENFFNSDCGSTPWARTLFIAWNILSMYIFVNLFVSLIYESFSYVYQRSSGLAELDRDEIRRFKEAWRSVDPNGTGFISKEAFPRLLSELSGVFEMRVYDSENSVGTILEDIRTENGGMGGLGGLSHSHVPHQQRHASLSSTTPAGAYGVDLAKLNARLSQIDVGRVRERRRRFNLFFEEVMVSADVDKGISFTTVLMILAHYNIINDSKSLRLEEFLKRRARLQRVEEELRRRVVLGFFVTLYWSRKFRRHMDLKRSARMTAVPQLDVPDILVEDDEAPAQRASYQDLFAADTAHFTDTPAGPSAISNTASIFSYRGPSIYLSAEDAAHPPGAAGGGSGRTRSWSGTSVDIASHAMSHGHPLSMPRTGGPASPTSPGFSPGTVPPMPQQGEGHTHQNSQNSAFSFELSDPSAGGYGSWNSTNSYYGSMGDPYQMHPSTSGQGQGEGGLQPPGGNAGSRRDSAVSPAQARDLLDDSVWVESIRRSVTQRKSGWGGSGGYYGS